MEFAGGINVYGSDVCLDDALDLVIWRTETINTLGVHTGPRQDAACVRINDEQWVLSSVQKHGIRAFASDLRECEECLTEGSTFTGYQRRAPTGCGAHLLRDAD